MVLQAIGQGRGDRVVSIASGNERKYINEVGGPVS